MYIYIYVYIYITYTYIMYMNIIYIYIYIYIYEFTYDTVEDKQSVFLASTTCVSHSYMRWVSRICFPGIQNVNCVWTTWHLRSQDTKGLPVDEPLLKRPLGGEVALLLRPPAQGTLAVAWRLLPPNSKHSQKRFNCLQPAHATKWTRFDRLRCRKVPPNV